MASGRGSNQFYVEIDGVGEPVWRDMMNDVVEMTVESSLHLPDAATIVLHDTRLKWIDDAKLEPGKALKIAAFDSRAEEPIFDGEIVEIEPEFAAGSQRLYVRAFDRLHRLGRGRHARSFVNVTDGDLVEKIAREVGLRTKIGPISGVHPYVFQNNQSNLAFLQERAAAHGYLLYADGETLCFTPPESDGQPVELKWRETLREFRPRMTTVAQVSASTVRGWDPEAKREIVGRVQHGTTAPKVGESRKGGQLAQTAFSLEAPQLTARGPVRTQAAADRLAQAVADRHASRFIEADGTCAGNAKIVAGASVKIVAVGDRFSGTYHVTTARHVLTPNEGYSTHFGISGQNPMTLLSLLVPDHSERPGGSLVIGIVTDNKDPDGQGRVKVKYPWLSADHGSHWARVVSVGGGPDRGIEFLPEVNDEVLIGFEQGDVHHAYVLGGLWNGRDKPPADKSKVVSGGKVQHRVIRSRVGHKITIDDTDGGGGITIEDSKGNTVKLDTGSSAINIKVQGDAKIESQGPMKLESRGQVTIKGMGVKIDGGAGTVDVKGSMINLN